MFCSLLCFRGHAVCFHHACQKLSSFGPLFCSFDSCFIALVFQLGTMPCGMFRHLSELGLSLCALLRGFPSFFCRPHLDFQLISQRFLAELAGLPHGSHFGIVPRVGVSLKVANARLSLLVEALHLLILFGLESFALLAHLLRRFGRHLFAILRGLLLHMLELMCGLCKL